MHAPVTERPEAVQLAAYQAKFQVVVNLMMEQHVFGLEAEPGHGALGLGTGCRVRLRSGRVAGRFALAEATLPARVAVDQEGYDLVPGPVEGLHTVHVVQKVVVETQDTEMAVARVTLRSTTCLSKLVLGAQCECVPFSLQELGLPQPAALVYNHFDSQGPGMLPLGMCQA